MKLDGPSDLDALRLLDSDDGVLQLEGALRELKDKPDWMLRSLLRLLERHPEHDFGAPGGIVHFLEGYSRREYEAELLASLRRMPTTHTTWMLNRLINGTNGPAKLEVLDAMKQLCKATRADVRECALEFVAFQAK